MSPIFSFLLLAAIPQTTASQEILVLHPHVGATIDLEEKIHYKLFTEIYNFADAQFYQTKPDTIVAKIRLWSSAGPEYRSFSLSPYEFYILAAGIDSKPLLTEKERQSIHKRFQPLYTDKYLSEIRENTYCRLKLKDKRTFDAVYYRFKGDSVYFWIDRQVIPIDKNNLVRLKYWDKYEQKNWVKWACMGGVALGAFYGSGLLAKWIDLSTENRILTQYSAASVGSIAGYLISPVVNDYLLSATIIEFRTSRIKRLDTIEKTSYTLGKIKDKIWQIIAQ
jgi:hypothetical protein